MAETVIEETEEFQLIRKESNAGFTVEYRAKPGTSQANRTEIETKAREALATNKAFVASTPSTAQAVAQVKSLSRQMNGVIRLLLNELGGTD